MNILFIKQTNSLILAQYKAINYSYLTYQKLYRPDSHIVFCSRVSSKQNFESISKQNREITNNAAYLTS